MGECARIRVGDGRRADEWTGVDSKSVPVPGESDPARGDKVSAATQAAPWRWIALGSVDSAAIEQVGVPQLPQLLPGPRQTPAEPTTLIASAAVLFKASMQDVSRS